MSSTRLPAALRRRQLLDRALELFADRGFHETSMNDVAEAAGVTKPVLYQHFASKRELYLELLEDVGAQLLEAIVASTAGARNPREQVQAGFAAYFRFVADHRNAFQLLFGGGARRDAEFADAVARVEEAIADAVAELIGLPLPDQDRAVLAHSIVGLAESTSRHWIAGRFDLSSEALAERTSELAWWGLRGVRTSR